jgi:hypothetical protein
MSLTTTDAVWRHPGHAAVWRQRDIAVDQSESHFRLRIPTGLKAAIEEMAAAEERSQNSQIVYLLKQAVQQRTEGAASNSAAA